MVNAQKWLDENYPKENRKNIKELIISNKDLEGNLDLVNFVNLEKLFCGSNQLTNLFLSNNCPNLTELYCGNNKLTNFDFSVLKSEKLRELSISDNNFSQSDLSIFSPFTSLEILYIGTDEEEKIKQNIYNRFAGSLESLKDLTKLRKLHISNTDVNDGVDCLPSIEKIYYSSKERPNSKVKEIAEQIKWKIRGFNKVQVEELIGSGLRSNDYDFASYLVKRTYNLQSNLDLGEIREEYNKSVQGWLDKNYPKENRKGNKIREIYLSEPDLKGELDLADFAYEWGFEIYISPCVDETRLEIKNQSKYAKIIKLIDSQEYINQKYPTKKVKEKVTKLNLEGLEGELDLSDFANLKMFDCSYRNKLTSLNLSNCSQLEKINCENNLLTNIALPINLINLKHLNLKNNNFSAQDLNFLVSATNLEELWLGNSDEEKIARGIYNRFSGSLDYLSGMKKLWRLTIDNTDINEVNTDKLPNSLITIWYSTEERLDNKLTQIAPQLDDWTWKDLNPGYPYFTLWERRKWERQKFNKEQTRTWIQAGVGPKDYNFSSYLRDSKKVTPKWVLNNKGEKNYQELKERCKFDWCRKCQQPNTSSSWCQPCREQEWQQDTKQLTGQQLISKFIQQQEEKRRWNNKLKWIPYEEFTSIEYLTQGGFAKVYKAKWGKGKWGNDRMVALKILNNSQNITLEFLSEIANTKLVDTEEWIVPCYGISQSPENNDYIMVMDYMEGGNLRQYLQQKGKGLSFKNKFGKLYGIFKGLNSIHLWGLTHRDFHPGNILISYDQQSRTADFGLCQPAYSKKEEGKIFGVLPYVAPEVLRGWPYTQKSDVYSFGIIAYELLTNTYPYPGLRDLYPNLKNDRERKLQFTLDVCNGLRPNLEEIEIPLLLKDLIKKCWKTDPEQRPITEELEEIIGAWDFEKHNDEKDTKFNRQTKEIESKYNQISQSASYKIPSSSVTTSELINTWEIAELFQNSEKQALELEVKKIEREINQPLTDELKELVGKFIRIRKEMIENENYEETKNKALELEDQLLNERGFSEESIEKIIDYCKRLVAEQEKLQSQIEILNDVTEQVVFFGKEEHIDSQVINLALQWIKKINEEASKDKINQKYLEEINRLQKNLDKLGELKKELKELQAQQEVSPN